MRELQKDTEIKDIEKNIAKNSNDCRQVVDIEVAKVLVGYPDFLYELQINLDHLKNIAVNFDKSGSDMHSQIPATADNPFRLTSGSQSGSPVHLTSQKLSPHLHFAHNY